MKRKVSSEAIDTQRGHRQPQVSCNSCRKKKLKCDRQQPCSNCEVRGLSCSGSQSVKLHHRVEKSADSMILERLRNLEEAVFGNNYRRSRITMNATPESEYYQAAKFLDSTYTMDNFGVSGSEDELRFQVANTATQLTSTTHSGGSGQTTWLMTRGEALSLLQDFVDRSYHLLLIIHESSTRSLVDQFYTRLSNGQRVNPSHASLILSISAISAYFWDESTTSHHGFASAAEAIQASLVWRTSALDILDGPRRGSYPCLEEIQARAILAYLVYSWEGCSARFRFLHSGSLVLAREMSLHLTDSPRSEQNDSPITKEIKRRLWWHLASTDWMLGFMGGPFDGTYTVQPRHMNVKYPRNLNDNDLNMCDSTFTYPINIPTQMSCFIQRIRLSEICRAIIDSRTPGLPDMEVIEYSQVLALDRLFEDTISELPPFLQLDGPIPPEAPRHLALQRSIIQLGLHSRRARLHRPFLLEETHDPRYQTSRVICLRSARIALSISTRILESSLGLHPASPGAPPSHRVGVVIGSMFVACTVLALSAGQSSNGGRTAPTIEETGLDIDVHAELANACRILAAIGEKSTLAAGLVRSLTGILRQYRVKGVDSVQTLHGSRDADTDAGPVHKENPEMSEGQKPSEAVSSDDAEPGLDQLWDEFMNTMPMIESWDQLLADLDSYFLA